MVAEVKAASAPGRCEHAAWRETRRGFSIGVRADAHKEGFIAIDGELTAARLRRKLHDRLASFPNEVTAEHEREISKQRRELHAEIDELRVKLRELQGR